MRLTRVERNEKLGVEMHSGPHVAQNICRLSDKSVILLLFTHSIRQSRVIVGGEGKSSEALARIRDAK